MNFTEEEFGLVEAVSSRVDLRPGSWTADLAVRYALNQLEPLSADARDLGAVCMQARYECAEAVRLLRRVEQLVGATGEVPEAVRRQLEMAEAILDRVDEATAEFARRPRVRRGRRIEEAGPETGLDS